MNWSLVLHLERLRWAVCTLALIFNALVGASSSGATAFDVYILTGQSNLLGTTDLEANPSPGTDSADVRTSFVWANASGGTSSNLRYPPALSTSSDPRITTLQVQGAFWGPEFGFARRMAQLGRDNVLIIKASKGGGRNLFWDKSAFDTNPNTGHMWGHLRDTVDRALNLLTVQRDTFEVKGFMYLQGESNKSEDARVARARLVDLIDNLQDFINSSYSNAATDMHTVIGEIAASQSDSIRALTTDEQITLAAHDPDVTFVATRDLPPNM